MDFETIKFELLESVAVVTLNRPDALNALSLQLVKDLREALRQVAEQRARAVVLTGAGRAFCSGGDLREMRQIAEKTGNLAAFFEEPLKALHDCILTIRQTPVP